MATREDISIRAGTARQIVITHSAIEHVVTGAARHAIVTRAGRYTIHRTGAIQLIISFSADDIKTPVNELLVSQARPIVELIETDSVGTVGIAAVEVIEVNHVALSSSMDAQKL